MAGHLLDEAVLAVGITLILLGMAAFRRTKKFIAGCRVASGRVTGYTTEESDEGVYYYSLIHFRDGSGAEREIRGSHGLQEPPAVGGDVSVTYDPAYPTNAWITGTGGAWAIPWLITIAGVATSIAGFAIKAAG